MLKFNDEKQQSKKAILRVDDNSYYREKELRECLCCEREEIINFHFSVLFAAVLKHIRGEEIEKKT